MVPGTKHYYMERVTGGQELKASGEVSTLKRWGFCLFVVVCLFVDGLFICMEVTV